MLSFVIITNHGKGKDIEGIYLLNSFLFKVIEHFVGTVIYYQEIKIIPYSSSEGYTNIIKAPTMSFFFFK